MATTQNESSKDAQTDTAPTTPAPSHPAILATQPVRSRHPITPFGRQSLAAFEASITAIATADVAKQLTNTMRSVVQLGGSKRRHLEPRRQRIRDIVMHSGSTKVESAYNEYAKLQVAAEKRSTYQLPLIGDALGSEGQRSHDKGNPGEASKTKESGGAEEDKEPLNAAVRMQRRRSSDGADQDTGMETVPTTDSAQPPIPQHTHIPEPASRSSRFTPQAMALFLEDAPPQPMKALPKPAGVTCDKHSDSECTLVPIINPEGFPVGHIQEVQAQYYPSTKILEMWIHRDTDGNVTQVTADIDSGSIDHLIINDARIITTLGVRHPPYEKILLNQYESRVDETYKIRILPNQHPKNKKAWIAGELVAARHPYLDWLDKRQDTDPKFPPTMAEARALARQLGRRLPHVMRELEAYWNMEHGDSGKLYRQNRLRYLGADPSYGKTEEMWPRRSEWA